MLCTTLWAPDYVVHHRPALCTTGFHFAPPGCVLHHGAQGGLMWFFGWQRKSILSPNIVYGNQPRNNHFWAIRWVGTKSYAAKTVPSSYTLPLQMVPDPFTFTMDLFFVFLYFIVMGWLPNKVSNKSLIVNLFSRHKSTIANTMTFSGDYGVSPLL